MASPTSQPELSPDHISQALQDTPVANDERHEDKDEEEELSLTLPTAITLPGGTTTVLDDTNAANRSAEDPGAENQEQEVLVN